MRFGNFVHSAAPMAIAIALAFGAPPVAAATGLDPDGLTRFKAAFAAVDALARETRKHGGLPRLGDQQGAAVLSKVWEVGGFIGAGPWTAKDVGPLLDIGDAEKALANMYTAFSPDGKSPPDTLANEKTFHPEITRSFAAFIPVEGAVVEAIGDFVRKLPKDQMTDVRRAGLKEARLGISRQFTGLLMVMTDGAAGDEAGNALVARAIAAAAPALAGAFGLGERAKLALALHGAADKLSGPAQADIAATAQAFEGRGCEALCSIE